MLLRERIELETKVKKWIPEANQLAKRYAFGRTYECRGGTGYFNIILNREGYYEQFGIIVKENGEVVRIIDARAFNREFDKLKNLKLRDQYRPHTLSPVKKNLTQQVKAKRENRKDIQDELRALLKNTTELTKQLENQLNELKRRGWNVPSD